MRDVPGFRDQDCQGCGEQGSCAYSGELSADVGTQRNYEEAQRADMKQAF